MKTRYVAIVMSACLSCCSSAFSQAPILSSNEEIRFEREIWMKISAPCTIEARGSKLTAYPYDMDFATFKKSVEWEFGMPGYLSGTEQGSTTFNFDISGRVVFKSDMVLKIIRTTANVTADGLLVIHKGSVRPKVIEGKNGDRKKD